ncbi:hypothetical protein [Bacillus infantis]|uniref:hypothetical protein n=1 Tax=Bacillus infantis TaxID=324767 RepID=UPI003CF7B119
MKNAKRLVAENEAYLQQFRRAKIYTTFEEVEETDWHWAEREIRKFDELWKADMPLREMAKELRRSELAVMLAAFDRLARGKIKPREGWRIW